MEIDVLHNILFDNVKCFKFLRASAGAGAGSGHGMGTTDKGHGQAKGANKENPDDVKRCKINYYTTSVNTVWENHQFWEVADQTVGSINEKCCLKHICTVCMGLDLLFILRRRIIQYVHVHSYLFCGWIYLIMHLWFGSCYTIIMVLDIIDLGCRTLSSSYYPAICY